LHRGTWAHDDSRETGFLQLTVTKRRLLIVSAGSDPSAGGVERFTAQIDRALAGAGWFISVVAPSSDPSRAAHRLGVAPLVSARLAAHAVKELPTPDVILSNGTLGAFLGPTARIHVYHGTMVGHSRSGDLGLPLRERARRIVGAGLAEALAGRRAVRVAVSESASDEVERYYRLKVHRVITNGVDVDLFAPRDRGEARRRLGLRDDTRYALFVGRAEMRKGTDLLVPACRTAGWELLLAGAEFDGGRGLGVLQPEALAWAYAAADAVLFPTRYEACSFVVLEALASGIPLVTTEVGWMRTFLRSVPEYRQLIVQPSAPDIAAKLRAVGSIPQALTTQARNWIAANSNVDRFSEQWVDLVERVASGKSTPNGGALLGGKSRLPR
jgi:glycosyltransferase involved in cell wall biosynthesis